MKDPSHLLRDQVKRLKGRDVLVAVHLSPLDGSAANAKTARVEMCQSRVGSVPRDHSTCFLSLNRAEVTPIALPSCPSFVTLLFIVQFFCKG